MLTPQMQTENGHVEAGLPNEVQVKSKVGPLAHSSHKAVLLPLEINFFVCRSFDILCWHGELLVCQHLRLRCQEQTCVCTPHTGAAGFTG